MLARQGVISAMYGKDEMLSKESIFRGLSFGSKLLFAAEKLGCVQDECSQSKIQKPRQPV